MDKCLVCKSPASQRCTRCKVAFYCGKECASEGWKGGHRFECCSSLIGNKVPVDLEKLYTQYTGGNENQRLAYKWLISVRLDPSWAPRTSVKNSWVRFLGDRLTKDNQNDAYRILSAFGITYHLDQSSGDYSDLARTLKNVMMADVVIDTFENTATVDNEGETVAKIVDTVVDEVQKGVDATLNVKVDELKVAERELEKKLNAAELTMLSMENELVTLRALLGERDQRIKVLERELSSSRSTSLPSVPTAPPMPPPPPPVVSLPAKPMAGALQSLRDIQLKTVQIEPAAREGAGKSENKLLSEIENFAKNKLKKASTKKEGGSPPEKSTPGGSLMESLSQALAKRRKGVAGSQKSETEEEKRAADAAFDLNESLVMNVIQGKYFRARVEAVIGSRFFL